MKNYTMFCRISLIFFAVTLVTVVILNVNIWTYWIGRYFEALEAARKSGTLGHPTGLEFALPILGSVGVSVLGFLPYHFFVLINMKIYKKQQIKKRFVTVSYFLSLLPELLLGLGVIGIWLVFMYVSIRRLFA